MYILGHAFHLQRRWGEMSTWKLVTCLYTMEKGKSLEEKLINNGLSNTLSVLVVGYPCRLWSENCSWHPDGYHGSRRWEGCPLPDPKSGGSLLDADKARELNSSAAVSQDSPSLSWEGRPGLRPAMTTAAVPYHGTQLYRKRSCLRDCFPCKLKSFLSLKLQWEEERNVPLMSASSRTGEQFFQKQFYSMQAGNLTLFGTLSLGEIMLRVL